MIFKILEICITDYWQDLSLKFGIIFGSIAAIIALFQAIYNTTYNRKKIRWEKAKLSYEMVESLYDFEPAHNALKMTDRNMKIISKEGLLITNSDVKKALTTNDDSVISQEIRESFDALYYYFERIENSIEIGVIRFEDIQSHFSYYVSIIKNETFYTEYAKTINYFKVITLINRYN